MLKNIIINNLSQALQFGSRWILNVILLRIMSISEFGLFSFLYSISNILSAVLPFGSSVYIFKENSNNGNKNLIIDSFIVVFISFFIIVFLYFCIFVFDITIRGAAYILYPIILGLLTSLNIILSSYLKSLNLFIKELKVYFLFSILLFGTVVYIYIKQTIDISDVFQILILINFITILFFIKTTSLKLRIIGFNQSLNSIKNLFNNRLYYGLQEIQTAIYGQSSMIILFYLLTTELYGTYRALFILIMPISLISYSISQVFINYLKKDIENIKIKFRNIAIFSFLIACTIILIFIVGQDILLSFIKLNSDYSNEYFILLLGMFFKILMTPYISLLVVLDMQKVRFYANLAGATFLLFSIFTFVKDYDLFNAILINTIAIILIFFIKFIFTHKALKR